MARLFPGQPGYLPKRNFRGSVFLLVVWTLFLLSSFALSLGLIVRQKLDLTSRLDTRDKMRLIGFCGLQKALAMFLSQPEAGYFSFKSPLCSNPSAFANLQAGDGSCDVYYTYSDGIDGSLLLYGITDEESRVNLNKADLALLKNLLIVVLGLDEQGSQSLAAAIIDWRDKDSELTTPNSAEDSYYQGLEYPYGCKDSRFEVIEELLLVKDITAGYFSRLKDYVSVYGSGRVNINTASRPILLAIGFSPDLAERFLALRKGFDGILATTDDLMLQDAADIIPALDAVYPLSEPEKELLAGVCLDYAGVDSNYFRAKSYARLFRHKSLSPAECVFDKKGKVVFLNQP